VGADHSTAMSGGGKAAVRGRAIVWALPALTMANDRIGEILVRESIISADQLRQAQHDTRNSGKRLAYSLAKLGILGEKELTEFMARQYGVPSISLSDFEIDR
jgi:hypothetical protein